MVLEFMVFHQAHHLLSIAILLLSFCLGGNNGLAQGSVDNERLLQRIQKAAHQWVADTNVEISDELQEKQMDSAIKLTLSTKILTLFVLMQDYHDKEISLASFGTAFGIMTALTFFSSKHLQRYDNLFSQPIPWKNLWPSFLRRAQAETADDAPQLLTIDDFKLRARAPFAENLFRRAAFSAVYFSILNAVLHTQNELVNSSHAIWTQDGMKETASLVLASSFGSSMFHAIRNTFVKNPVKSEKIYSNTSMVALNLMGLYQLGIHGPMLFPDSPVAISTTLFATYAAYGAGSVISFFSRERPPKKPRKYYLKSLKKLSSLLFRSHYKRKKHKCFDLLKDL